MVSIIKKSTKKATKSFGFTLVELSLSIAFIAILSITIVLIITNTIASYHRGLTLSQLNTVGMDLVNDMRASLQNSVIHSAVSACSSTYKDPAVVDTCKNDNASKFVSVARIAGVKIGSANRQEVPVFGAFCTGNYSYIWNSGYYFSSDYTVIDMPNPAEFHYNLASGSSDSATSKTLTNFKLLKVKDESRQVCIAAVYGKSDSDGSYGATINQGKNIFDITAYGSLAEEPEDILGSNSNMSIYDISSALPAESTSGNNAFYSVSFILGTVHGGINVATAGNYCATPEGYNAAVANFDYCAINKFNFAARSVGG